ncbi:unnamed protein product [Camellia sinensis]
MVDPSNLPPNLTLLISNLFSFVNVKLDSSNYIVWKNQLLNILRATKLLCYVDGSLPCPPWIVLDSLNKEVVNPKHQQWLTVDAHLLSCITATLSPPIFTSVCSCKSSFEVWISLEKQFLFLSRSHIHQLKNQLNRLSKKGHLMEDYLGQVKTLSDQLTLVSSPIDDEDLVLIILNGLPDEYSAFKTTIQARAKSISVDCLCSSLCSEAVHVKSSAKHSGSADVPFAYVSNRQNSSPFAKSVRGGYRGGYSRNFNRGGRFFKGNRNRSGRGSRLSTPNSASASYSSGSPTSLLICQICGKVNHTALDCWCRMDQSFKVLHLL